METPLLLHCDLRREDKRTEQSAFDRRLNRLSHACDRPKAGTPQLRMAVMPIANEATQVSGLLLMSNSF